MADGDHAAKVAEVGIVVDFDEIKGSARGRDWVIAEIAGRQYGVVSRAQLVAAGIGPGAIETRIRRFGLLPLHRGVYAVGHTALVPLAREMAAVLACGPGAVVSHSSAAGAIWCLLDPLAGPVDITIPRSNRRRPGIRVHRSRLLEPQDRRVICGVPVTSPERTLIDLAETADGRELERAYDEALTQRLTSPSSMAAAVGRLRGRRGLARIEALVARDGEPAFTRSQAEERMLELARNARLPAARTNRRIGRHTVDFEWQAERLVVEVDGYRFHSTRSAFERDRRRDAELMAAGYRVIRVTWRQLESEPLAVVARIAQALAA